MTMLTFNAFKTALNAISLQFDALKKSFDRIAERISSTEAAIPEPDWDENDPESKNYVKNRTHWEEVETVDIVGQTYTIENLLQGNGYRYDEYERIPFCLGQVWTVTTNKSPIYESLEVQKYNDGTLYIGSWDYNEIPFCFTETSVKVNASFLSVTGVTSFTLSGISGTMEIRDTHQLDVKYIPDEVCRKNELPVKSGGGESSTIQGEKTTASGECSHAEGYNTTASGYCSHAEGFATKASGRYSHAEGQYNIEDTENKYAHIVGNGTSDSARSNAHTLDWKGNAWFAGTVEGTKLILKSVTSGSTKRFEITVDDSGTISAKEITS